MLKKSGPAPHQNGICIRRALQYAHPHKTNLLQRLFPRYKFAHGAGFTLIEILVVMAILAILGVIVAPSFIQFQRASQLEASAQLVETALAKSFSQARSQPKIFGIQRMQDARFFEAFDCSSPNCEQKDLVPQGLEPNVTIKDGFEIQFFPPYGDLKFFDKNGNELEDSDFLLVTLDNLHGKVSLKIYKESGLIERTTPPE